MKSEKSILNASEDADMSYLYQLFWYPQNLNGLLDLYFFKKELGKYRNSFDCEAYNYKNTSTVLLIFPRKYGIGFKIDLHQSLPQCNILYPSLLKMTYYF